MKIHEKYISRCIEIAQNGLGNTRPNPMVGCVIVHNELILSEGFTSPYGGNHAEVNAINSVADKSLLANAAYFVVEDKDGILGCCGVAQLENYEGNVCELQKMYFLCKARGRGLGAEMIQVCLNKAKEYGFEKCYLETMPYMKAAQKLYLKSGFEYIEAPMGDTGHYSCQVWMIKEL